MTSDLAEHSPAMPVTSEASIKNGYWFISPIQGFVVRAWGSALTGIERVYLDSLVVSEHRNAGKYSEHRFQAHGDDFMVTFTTKSLLRGPLDCRLIRNGIVIGALRFTFNHRGLFSEVRPQFLLVYLLLG